MTSPSIPRSRPRVAIIGAGLGGLATAVGLSAHGFPVDVFEQSGQLGEIGAGINLSPNASKALAGLGLYDRIGAVANSPAAMEARDMQTGRVLSTVKVGEMARSLGGAYWQVHRADLLETIADAIDADRLHLGHRLTDLEQCGDTVRLAFANGGVHEADIVIGADGVHSPVRASLWGGESPKFFGQVICRSLLPGDAVPREVLGESGSASWMGPGHHAIAYYLRGHSLISFIAQSDSDNWVEESWRIAGDPDALRASLWADAEPRLRQLLAAITECSKWGLFSREPSPAWGRGRITLIGDAAHPMLPNAGQGAAQAFEDAYVLSRWLAEHPDDPVGALAGYEAVRKPRAHAIQRQSAENARFYHPKGPAEVAERERIIAEREARGETFHNLGWIYAHDPVTAWNKVPQPA